MAVLCTLTGSHGIPEAIGISQTFTLKTVKSKLTRLLNHLANLTQEAMVFQKPWEFPEKLTDVQQYVSTKTIQIKELMSQLEEQRDAIWNCYNECNCTIANLSRTAPQEGSEFETNFDLYWKEKKAESILEQTTALIRQLSLRKMELDCQAASIRNEILLTKGETSRTETNDNQEHNTAPQLNMPANWQTLDRRLLGNELRVPEFDGNPTEFNAFWELFEELVHKQPYTNIEKLSILLSCCKGDASRALRMIPRTGESYEIAITQLKEQYQDTKRTTITLLRDLQTMKPCKDDPKSLRNTLNDVKAIISALRKQGEAVDTTPMTNMVLSAFSSATQEELARKEFDSGKTWNMSELIENINNVVKRREHLDLRNTTTEDQGLYSFHTKLTRPNERQKCIGCGKLQFQKLPCVPNTVRKGRAHEINKGVLEMLQPPTQICPMQSTKLSILRTKPCHHPLPELVREKTTVPLRTKR
ncbi:unnamed protein product [Heligmosomoides polygyrus]|uniref:Retrotrans_gag domain-containing protein n=1 Tax=Heligmosomoides polygyrus TaxID=6339 RepID=A0A183FWD5_HELPZ|nr:unnamed protein product [Heligmosomoides polygyrus]